MCALISFTLVLADVVEVSPEMFAHSYGWWFFFYMLCKKLYGMTQPHTGGPMFQGLAPTDEHKMGSNPPLLQHLPEIAQ